MGDPWIDHGGKGLTGAMNKERRQTHFERMRALRWNAAADEWSPIARDLLLDYYERILPVWPEDDVKILPHNSVLMEAFSRRLTANERIQVDVMLRVILEAASRAGAEPTSMLRALQTLILTCGLLVERGALASDDDPSEPLLQLLEAGFTLNPSHGAVDICHRVGCTTVPLQTREAIARRAGTRELPRT